MREVQITSHDGRLALATWKELSLHGRTCQMFWNITPCCYCV